MVGNKGCRFLADIFLSKGDASKMIFVLLQVSMWLYDLFSYWITLCFHREPLITNIMWRNLFIQASDFFSSFRLHRWLILLNHIIIWVLYISGWPLIFFLIIVGLLSSYCAPCAQLPGHQYSPFKELHQGRC